MVGPVKRLPSTQQPLEFLEDLTHAATVTMSGVSYSLVSVHPALIDVNTKLARYRIRTAKL
jgi:hypothetical protein